MIHEKNDPVVFPKLTDEQVTRLLPYGEAKDYKPGECLFEDGDRVDSFYVVLGGEVRITLTTPNGEETVVATHPPGEFTGQLAVLAGNRARHRARAIKGSRILEITSDAFRNVAAQEPEIADVFISTLARRLRESQAWFRQTEKLAALGKLSAGLAHELNNPAAAARRAANEMREAVLRSQEEALKNDGRFSEGEKEELATLLREATSRSGAVLDPLEQSDREDEFADWLDERGVEDAWELAPALVSAGLTAERLEGAAGGGALAGGVAWLAATLNLSSLADEVEKSAARISELVGAMKEYSYMDRASMGEVDVHEGLESTLTILGHKLKRGDVAVKKEYDRGLPRVPAHGGELNQVWTNLIDNAIDAMNGRGTLSIKTSRDGGYAVVEVEDSGPGVPKELRNRIFEPFFTTKGVGEGTGLGLDIVRRIVVERHGGDVRVDSKPGKTRFTVRLPLVREQREGR